jgi:hypothetical protein
MLEIKHILTILAILLVVSFFWMSFTNNGTKTNKTVTGAVIADLNDKSNNEQEIVKEERNIYSDNLHFNHVPITYNFEVVPTKNGYYSCPDAQKERTKKAFEMIKNETDNSLSFKEVENNEDIQIFCYGMKISDSSSQWYSMTEGEGGYELLGNEITSGTLNFYDAMSPQNQRRNCIDLELHEIFHILGFNHVDDKNSLMYTEQWGPCKYKIDD